MYWDLWELLGSWGMGTLIFTLVVAQVLTLFFTAYQSAISLVGMLRHRLKSVEGSMGRRFALLVCAHNEESVVGEIIKNLSSLDYPKEMYDIYVIADNCTDDTASVSRSLGAIVFERFDSNNVGKGYGVEWMLNNLWSMEKYGNKYDAVAIFDADNLVTANALKQINAKMDEGNEAVQIYLDSKNPSDTWVSKSYAFAYWATNRIYQLARENIGLSAQLGGTGMVFSTDVIKEMGWGATSLTEDLEFTTKYVLERDKRVAWVHGARIYDEKPLRMKQSYVQRIRWMKGHFDCATRFFLPLVKKIFTGKGNRLSYLDVLVYLIQPVKIVLAMAGLGFFLLSWLKPLPDFVQEWVLSGYVWWPVLLLFYLQPFWGMILEKKSSKVLWFFQVYVFSLSWIPIVAYAWFKRKDRTWSHTKHTRAMGIEEAMKGGGVEL